MSNFIAYLKKNLNFNDFILLQTSSNKFIIFKSYTKYSKCIYLQFINEKLEINIHKVFDSKYHYNNFERLIIDKKYFDNCYDSFEYIQKNVAI